MSNVDRTSEHCVWVRLPDLMNPLDLKPCRFQANCDGRVARGAHPFYPDICPSCDRPVRIAT